jgi:hypothetical protein
MRYLILPMIGTGTITDTRRPKYLQEVGLAWSIRNARQWCFAAVTGSDAVVDAVVANADVYEVDEQSLAALPQNVKNKIAQLTNNLPLEDVSNGKQLAGSLRKAILAKQIAGWP